MRNHLLSSVTVAAVLMASVPAFAQDATQGGAAATADAPMTTAPSAAAPAPAAPAVTIVAPEGYAIAEITSVTADELKGVNVYDAEGKDVAEISDVVIGTDNAVTGLVTDVGGFLGMGEHRISLNPDQVHIYKNADGDLRAFVTLTKDEMKALPAYVAP